MGDRSPDRSRLFVYGTLRRGLADNATARAFRAGATFLCDGWLPGTLYSLGWYPALVEEGTGRVRGEVWRLEAPGLLRALDAYEGLFEEGPPQYRRLRRAIHTAHGPVTAWAYLHAGGLDPGRRIPSGDWARAVTLP